MTLVRYADRPDLLAVRFDLLARRTFPEYMNHNVPGERYWDGSWTDQVRLRDGSERSLSLRVPPEG